MSGVGAGAGAGGSAVAAATTTPTGASSSPSQALFILSELGWTPPPNLMEFGANGGFAVQEQPSHTALACLEAWPVLISRGLTPATSPMLNSATFSYFFEQVEPPFIANIDTLNWKPMKQYMVDLACRHPVVWQAISAVESLYKAKANYDDNMNSMAAYYAAKGGYASMLERGGDDPETFMVVTFLLCCFEIVAQHETVSITLKPEGALVANLEAWEAIAPYAWSPVLRRLQAWFQILHARTLHLGGRGLLSPKVSRLLKGNHQGQTPALNPLEDQTPDPDQAIVRDLSSTLFEFYLEVQDISIQITGLNRHHRSRGFQTDEREVEEVAEKIQESLDYLWQRRPALLRAERQQLQEHLSPTLRGPLNRLVDLCTTAYYTEIIYLGRAHGKTPSASPEALQAMHRIHHIVDSRFERSKLDPGFIWPLFMYAVEHPDADHCHWAVETLREVRNPIWHSDFVANLAQGISEEQVARAKRVDTRYFCLERFSMPPPFI
ncbi:hypothetical protein PENSUB_1608 [Penicillium subrubescens]|uniref:Uncharacterized protein n=1 Tax=Penicillium subrubescens TaxID=1316194 RepID=A0A1Q5UK69_9EURO|nr:hypothetical protein PENSUB_1608 [Penicillium subrubescens]